MLRGDGGIEGLNDEAFRVRGLGGTEEAGAENTIHCLFHRLRSTAVFLFKKGGYVVVDGQSRPHITMLAAKAS